MFLSAPSEVACRTEEGNGLKNGLKNDALEETTEEPISRALAEVCFFSLSNPFLPYVARPSLPCVQKNNCFSLFLIRVDRSARRHLGEDAVRGRHGLRQATTPQRSHRRDLHVRRHPHLVEGAHSNTHTLWPVCHKHTLARVLQIHSGRVLQTHSCRMAHTPIPTPLLNDISRFPQCLHMFFFSPV